MKEQELLEFIAKNLVGKPDEVTVIVEETESSRTLKLSVAEGDMGKVIGRQGRIAKAIRAVVKAATARDSKKVFVDIV